MNHGSTNHYCSKPGGTLRLDSGVLRAFSTEGLGLRVWGLGFRV